jgi:hypothetical protein
MRKLLWIGWGTALLGCVVGLWFLVATWPATDYYPVEKTTAQSPAQKAKEEDSEPSDVVEPLIVDPGPPQVIGKGEVGPLVEGEFGVEIGLQPPAPVSRAVLEPGMKQPPRPDAETGVALRMPYADEKVVGSGPPRSEKVEEENPVEESEPKVPEAPAVDPQDQHCPSTGRCPAPYPYRTPPR